jgi:8-oxo-dGTP diphosphatase
MVKYVAGFMFDLQRSVVLLVEKERPAWMQGYLNGIGGHVKEGESSIAAMVREFSEETGIATLNNEWVSYARLTGDNDGGWEVEWYWATRNNSELQLARPPVGGERLHLVLTGAVLGGTAGTMANLPWLMALALANFAGKDRCRYHVIHEERP